MEDKVFAMLKPLTAPLNTSLPPARSLCPLLRPRPQPPPNVRTVSLPGGLPPKNRLTPTKEPLTAAQQVIQEAKEKEKREKKEAKKGRTRGVPENGPAHQRISTTTQLCSASLRPRDPLQCTSATSAPSSPTPGSQNLPPSLPASLAPSPLRSGENRGTSPSRSPSRDPPPLYAQFNEQGTLDLPGTLLVIARRFEKLEKWTVGHVRALEERMSDVERWLVDKEGEKENAVSKVDESSALEGTVNEMRDELMEMQGRIGELGREVAKTRHCTLLSYPPCPRAYLHKPCPPLRRPTLHLRFTHRPAPLSRSTPTPSPTYTPAALSFSHVFPERPPATRLHQSPVRPSISHPRGAATLATAVPNGRLHLSSRLRHRGRARSRPRSRRRQ
jgi:hypothetical protein